MITKQKHRASSNATTAFPQIYSERTVQTHSNKLAGRNEYIFCGKFVKIRRIYKQWLNKMENSRDG